MAMHMLTTNQEYRKITITIITKCFQNENENYILLFI